MKRKPTHTFLPIAISFFILVFPFYLRCPYFAEADPFPTDLGFETPDQDDEFVDQPQDGSKALGLTSFPYGVFLRAVFFKHFPYSFSQTSSLNQEDLILRC